MISRYFILPVALPLFIIRTSFAMPGTANDLPMEIDFKYLKYIDNAANSNNTQLNNNYHNVDLNKRLILDDRNINKSLLIKDNAYVIASSNDRTSENPLVLNNVKIMDSGSLLLEGYTTTLGGLLVAENARLHVANGNYNLPNFSQTSYLAQSYNYIKNLSLIGNVYIYPRKPYPEYDLISPENHQPLPPVPAPLPNNYFNTISNPTRKPGPTLTTYIENLSMYQSSKVDMRIYQPGIQFNRLIIRTLGGDGLFSMNSSLTNGVSDYIQVIDQASGNFRIELNDAGVGDGSVDSIPLIEIAKGDADFKLERKNGIVEAGNWQYILDKRDGYAHTMWHLVKRRLPTALNLAEFPFSTAESNEKENDEIQKIKPIPHPRTQQLLSQIEKLPQTDLDIQTKILLPPPSPQLSSLTEASTSRAMMPKAQPRARPAGLSSHLATQTAASFSSELPASVPTSPVDKTIQKASLEAKSAELPVTAVQSNAVNESLSSSFVIPPDAESIIARDNCQILAYKPKVFPPVKPDFRPEAVIPPVQVTVDTPHETQAIATTLTTQERSHNAEPSPEDGSRAAESEPVLKRNTLQVKNHPQKQDTPGPKSEIVQNVTAVKTSYQQQKSSLLTDAHIGDEVDHASKRPKQSEIAQQPALGRAFLSQSANAAMNIADGTQHILLTEIPTFEQRQMFSKHNGPVSVWTRYLRDNTHLDNRYNNPINLSQSGMQIGVDYTWSLTDSEASLGVYFSKSHSGISSNSLASGSIQNSGGGIYGSWQKREGGFVDAVIAISSPTHKINTMMNAGQPVRGSYQQQALSATLESGLEVAIRDNVKMVPYGRLSYIDLAHKDYSLDNGMKISLSHGDHWHSELGISLKSNIATSGISIKPHLSLAMIHRQSENKLAINGEDFGDQVSNSFIKYSAGITFDIAKDISGFADYNYQQGSKISTPSSINFGLKMHF